MDEDYSPWGDAGGSSSPKPFSSSSTTPFHARVPSFELSESASTSDTTSTAHAAPAGFELPSPRIDVDDDAGFGGYGARASGWNPEAEEEFESAGAMQTRKGSWGFDIDDDQSHYYPHGDQSRTGELEGDGTATGEIDDSFAMNDDTIDEETPGNDKDERDWGGFGQSPTLPPIRDDDDDDDRNDDEAATKPASPGTSLPTEGWSKEWVPPDIDDAPPPPLPTISDMFSVRPADTVSNGADEPAIDDRPNWSPVDVKPSWEPDSLTLEQPSAQEQPSTDSGWADQPSQGLVKGKSIPAAMIDELKVKSRDFASTTWRVPDSTWGTAGFQERLSASLLDTLSELPSSSTNAHASTSALTLDTLLASMFRQTTVVYPSYRRGIEQTAASTAETLKGTQSKAYRNAKFARSTLGSSTYSAGGEARVVRTGTPPPPSSMASQSLYDSRGSNEDSPTRQQQGALGRLFGRFRRQPSGPSVPGPTAASVLGVPYDEPTSEDASSVAVSTHADPFSVFNDQSSSATQAPTSRVGGDELDDFFSSAPPKASPTTTRPIVRQELPRSTNTFDAFDPLVNDDTPFSNRQRSSAAPLAPVASFQPKVVSTQPSTGQDDVDDFFASFSSPPSTSRSIAATHSPSPPVAATKQRPLQPILASVRTSPSASATSSPLASPPISPPRMTTSSQPPQQRVIPRLAPPPPPPPASSSSGRSSPLSPGFTNDLASLSVVGGGSRSTTPSVPPPPTSAPSLSGISFDSSVLVPSAAARASGTTPASGSKSAYVPNNKQQGTTLTSDDLSFFESL